MALKPIRTYKFADAGQKQAVPNGPTIGWASDDVPPKREQFNDQFNLLGQWIEWIELEIPEEISRVESDFATEIARVDASVADARLWTVIGSGTNTSGGHWVLTGAGAASAVLCEWGRSTIDDAQAGVLIPARAATVYGQTNIWMTATAAGTSNVASIRSIGPAGVTIALNAFPSGELNTGPLNWQYSIRIPRP